MPTMDIFQNSTFIGTKTFERYVMIKERDGDLWWETEDDPGRGGGVLIWARLEIERYNIAFVLPKWNLIIDGVAQPSDYYQDVVLDNRKIELKFRDYHFVFR